MNCVATLGQRSYTLFGIWLITVLLFSFLFFGGFFCRRRGGGGREVLGYKSPEAESAARNSTNQVIHSFKVIVSY